MNEVELLSQEYLRLQSIYEDFDDRALLIKGWSITIALAGLAKAAEKRDTTIAMLSGLAACLFWLVESIWKGFQAFFVKRITDIEAWFRNRASSDSETVVGKDLVPMQIYADWSSAFDSAWWTEIPRQLILPHVFLPHLIVLVLALVLIARFRKG